MVCICPLLGNLRIFFVDKGSESFIFKLAFAANASAFLHQCVSIFIYWNVYLWIWYPLNHLWKWLYITWIMWSSVLGKIWSSIEQTYKIMVEINGRDQWNFQIEHCLAACLIILACEECILFKQPHAKQRTTKFGGLVCAGKQVTEQVKCIQREMLKNNSIFVKFWSYK